SRIGVNGYVRADVVRRKWDDFYVKVLDRTTGKFEDPLDLGVTTDASILTNDPGGLERNYTGLILQGSYRLSQRLNFGGNYTWSESKGNTNGETGPSGPVPDTYLVYPEFKAFAQNNPTGFLANDQTHKLRAWVSYDQPTPIGTFNFTVLERFDSGSPYSAIASVPTSQETCLDAAGDAAETAICGTLPTLAQFGYLTGE